eukprot:XP_001703559.1 predicted protein [Chlamydomonas reinhardtii]
MERPLQRFLQRFPDARNAPGVAKVLAGQASLDEVAAALEGVLTQPIYTLALGDALRATGSLLRLLSYLVERRLSADLAATPSADGGASGAFAVMLVTILELAPQCGSGHCFVATPTVRRNLEAAALVLCQGLPLLLEGPPGAGKTRLVEELAARTGNGGGLVRIHLDDQMDAKSLLGAYVCTAVPGEFAWQPGPLTQAVAEGRWVLVEDINMAPGDVLAALVPLLESRVLHLGGLDPRLREAAFVEAADCFAALVAKPEARQRLLKRIAAALSCNEPVLLVGETGTGKTTMLGRMAALAGAKLVSFNLSQQTDSSDLLGGFKPVEPRDALAPLLPTFMGLIRRTWTRGNNDEYLARVAKLAERRKWGSLLAAFRVFSGDLAAAERAAAVAEGGFAFAFVEGVLVQALRNGWWLLLDEINLAPAEDTRLVDGAGQKPAYNLRTLARALDYARAAAPSYGLQRALYDGAAMAFLTQLAPGSAPRMEALIAKHLVPGVKNVKSLLRAPPEPAGQTHTLFEAFWLECGPLELPGPTSAGKTSLVGYLAAQTGHTFLRINNHEHTDLQEYLGSYVSDAAGRLVFREGPLVQAVRRGWWVVLDELNLAPTEVLEALNRLLDDNRELLVPELNEVVKPHPHFMLFATQNPPGGAYAGRKVLSRAFRSRFLELHIDDIPDGGELDYDQRAGIWELGVLGKRCLARPGLIAGKYDYLGHGNHATLGKLVGIELAEILEKRCAVAPSYAAKLVAVQRELQRRRNAHSVFAGKHGFITPRDLFRWAERGAIGYEALGADGALLLGERLRNPAERAEVVGVLEKVMNVKVDLEAVVLEPGRTLTLAERGGEGAEVVVAAPGFRLLATMNPGGDFGKKELSPALANRFTTVWVPAMEDAEEMRAILEARLSASFDRAAIAERLLRFWQEYQRLQPPGGRQPFSVRDLLAWVGFVNATAPHLGALPAYAHGAHLTLLDGIGLGLRKAVLLEGSPGVGKTSLVAALAKSVGQTLFAWVDGPLLGALRAGHWVLLDELNLAGQSVLEGLNALLDHRSEVFIPELGAVFRCHPDFRLFAAQNPVGEGGGRKGLPRSFLNRFTRVTVELLRRSDLLFIAGTLHPRVPAPLLTRMHFARMLFAHRLRTGADRAKLAKLFAAVWSAGGGASQAPGDRKALAAHGPSCWTEEPPVLLSPTTAVVGRAIIKRAAQPSPGGLSPTVASGGGAPQLQLLPWSLPLLESLVQALGRGWMALLVGGPGSGKTSPRTEWSRWRNEAAAAVGGRFEWVDGALTRAIERGGWVLLEGSNLCNPTVLDRLNPLLEPGGCLYLNECGHDADGNPRLIRPHPDFRLLLALDPRHGEVSRAMRNRGIEIFLLPPAPPAAEAKAAGRKEEPAQEQAQRGLEEVVDADVEAVVRSAGVACKRLLRALARAHRGVAALAATDAEHPAVDVLYPLMSALGDLEQQLLAAPADALPDADIEELVGVEEAPGLRQAVAEAVALGLCVDPGLRRSVGRGVAMLGSMPLMEVQSKAMRIQQLRAAVATLLTQTQTQHSTHDIRALTVSGASPANARGYSPAREGRDAEVALRGRAWALLGLLRLQLVAPPPGIDPAGKYGLKRRHVEGVLVHELQPQILRDAFDFSASVAAPRRVLALLEALSAGCVSSSSRASGQATAAALQEARVWSENARAWAERYLGQYAWYPDLTQPVALAVHELVRGMELLASVAATAAGGGASAVLPELEQLLCSLVDTWAALKAHEEAVAAEEAQQFKSKASTNTFLNEDQELEATYRLTFPDHYAAFRDLRAVALRVLALPLTSPLKAALTGLELLLSRAQVWEETAAQFVSLKAQLGPLAALAARWRRLELSSWKSLLRRAFIQTSTLGEFRARLGLMAAFAGHVEFAPTVDAALTAGMAPLEKDLQVCTDFVALARWDDRGYYAMRASTEKAQRYLHRLSRRAEDVLRAAAATALAAAGADADGDADDTAERWTATAGKLTQVLSEDKALASALTAAGSAAPTVPGADGAAGASSSSYLPRLPQLAARLTRVIGDSFKPATPGPSANGAEAEAADGGDAGPDMTADELATAAIVRSQELRADVSKGARMRKRQALADFLEALEAQGLSRRQTGVPLHDRDVAACSSGTVAVVTATNELEAALKLPRARELAAAAAASLCQLTAASSSASAGPLLRGTASMLGLAAEALRLRGLRLLGLHRTTAKLAFVSGAVLATLVEEGYCVPDETKEGVEMDDDFEGALHDVPMDEQDKNRDSEDEEGDDDRIDQQMGDVGDNDEGPEEAPPENGGEDEDEEGPINDDTDDKYEDKNHAAPQMPRTWGGKQKRPQLAAEGVKGGEAEGGKDGEGKDGEGEAEGEKRPGMDELFGTEAEREQGGDADAEAEPSRVVAKLANASLKDDIEDRDAAAKAAAEAARDLEKPGPKGLTPEQLRLILEPTLASKLAGDYRTGKRINMKKVIGYIASHFRRDKIWLRRNRPDKRRYQVLLALEVGQVGVLKFGGGEGVVPLQPLDAPFGDSVGPSLAARLTFRQDNTIADRPMLQLMASLDHILASARHSSGAGGIGAGTQDLAQLVLILADGRFHEKESLHAAVREAAAKRGVCLAFIVLDTPGNSLLDMQSVSFGPGGKPVFTKYLDSFPFPYYIVLKDIAALPATLADLLRQWFELSTAANMSPKYRTCPRRR